MFVHIGPWQMWIRMVGYKGMSSFWPCTWWTWLKLADLYLSHCLKTWYLPLSGKVYTLEIDTLTGFMKTIIITTTFSLISEEESSPVSLLMERDPT